MHIAQWKNDTMSHHLNFLIAHTNNQIKSLSYETYSMVLGKNKLKLFHNWSLNVIPELIKQQKTSTIHQNIVTDFFIQYSIIE